MNAFSARSAARPPRSRIRPQGVARSWSRLFFGFLFLTLLPGLTVARAAPEAMPPAPRDHLNDYAGLVRAETARQLNRELADFERATSNQIIVAIFPKMASASSIEDYTVRVFQAWKVGQAGRNNGAVLFVFRDDRKVRIVTGYGLEGALPDALAKRIIENEITPAFRRGDFTAGVAAGTRAMMAAARGEYRGTGRTEADRRRGRGGAELGSGGVALVIFLIVVASIARAIFGRRTTIYTRGGRRHAWSHSTPWWTGGSGGGGGGWGGGSSGGSFSGGGGSTGGGGAGGSW